MISDKWKTLSDDIKLPYLKLSNVEKEKYKKEKEKFCARLDMININTDMLN